MRQSWVLSGCEHDESLPESDGRTHHRPRHSQSLGFPDPLWYQSLTEGLSLILPLSGLQQQVHQLRQKDPEGEGEGVVAMQRRQPSLHAPPPLHLLPLPQMLSQMCGMCGMCGVSYLSLSTRLSLLSEPLWERAGMRRGGGWGPKSLAALQWQADGSLLVPPCPYPCLCCLGDLLFLLEGD